LSKQREDGEWFELWENIQDVKKIIGKSAIKKFQWGGHLREKFVNF